MNPSHDPSQWDDDWVDGDATPRSYQPQEGSYMKKHLTVGHHYRDGFPRPKDRDGVLHHRAGGRVEPKGKYPYALPEPFTKGGVMEEDYKDYKKMHQDYGVMNSAFEDQVARRRSQTSNTFNGSKGAKFDRQGHQDMYEYADRAYRTGTQAATARMNFENDHIGRQRKQGREGHYQEARSVMAGAGEYGRQAHYHKHSLDGGIPQDWQRHHDQYRTIDRQAKQFEEQRTRDHRESREHFQRTGSYGGGQRLQNGRDEWIDVGGGRRRYYDEEENDYVAPPPDSRYY